METNAVSPLQPVCLWGTGSIEFTIVDLGGLALRGLEEQVCWSEMQRRLNPSSSLDVYIGKKIMVSRLLFES